MDPYLSVVSTFLSEAGLDVTLAPPLCQWVQAVASWNRRIDLTAARNDDELVDLMIADAVVLSQRLSAPGLSAPGLSARGLNNSGEERRRVVDVGTGAGAPGLPLAILRPDLEVTLVEPLQKRVALLRMTQGKLRRQGLAPGLTVVRGKGEDLKGRFDVALSRATLSPPDWLALGGRLAPEVVVLLAQQDPPSASGWEVVDDHRYRWPRTGAERRMLAYRPA